MNREIESKILKEAQRKLGVVDISELVYIPKQYVDEFRKHGLDVLYTRGYYVVCKPVWDEFLALRDGKSLYKNKLTDRQINTILKWVEDSLRNNWNDLRISFTGVAWRGIWVDDYTLKKVREERQSEIGIKFTVEVGKLKKFRITKEMIKNAKPNSIIYANDTIDGTDGFNMTNSRKVLRFVVVRGGVADWCVYTQFAERCLSDQEIKQWGDKVHSEQHLLNVLDFNSDVWKMYRH